MPHSYFVQDGTGRYTVAWMGLNVEIRSLVALWVQTVHTCTSGTSALAAEVREILVGQCMHVVQWLQLVSLRAQAVHAYASGASALSDKEAACICMNVHVWLEAFTRRLQHEYCHSPASPAPDAAASLSGPLCFGADSIAQDPF